MFYGVKFLSLLDGTLFYPLKTGQRQFFWKSFPILKGEGGIKEILVNKQCSLNAVQFKLAFQIYVYIKLVISFLSVNYMSSWIWVKKIFLMETERIFCYKNIGKCNWNFFFFTPSWIKKKWQRQPWFKFSSTPPFFRHCRVSVYFFHYYVTFIEF